MNLLNEMNGVSSALIKMLYVHILSLTWCIYFCVIYLTFSQLCPLLSISSGPQNVCLEKLCLDSALIPLAALHCSLAHIVVFIFSNLLYLNLPLINESSHFCSSCLYTPISQFLAKNNASYHEYHQGTGCTSWNPLYINGFYGVFRNMLYLQRQTICTVRSK